MPLYNPASTSVAKNLLLNSNFDFWQRGITNTVPNVALKYCADRWGVYNGLGTNSIISLSRTTGVSTGSKYGCRFQISTAPTAAQANTIQLFQTLENLKTLEVYNGTVSLSVKIKALNNVNAATVSVIYQTTEASGTAGTLATQSFSVNGSGFTTCTINNIAVGTSMTTSGVISILIEPTAVSSGNIYDLLNGLDVEQAMLNAGTTVAAYQRASPTIGAELLACQRFYSKSYNTDTTPATSSLPGARNCIGSSAANTGIFLGLMHFPVPMFKVPTVVIYSPAGTSGKMYNNSDADTGSNAAANDVGQSGWRYISITSGTAGQVHTFHYTAEAEIT